MAGKKKVTKRQSDDIRSAPILFKKICLVLSPAQVDRSIHRGVIRYGVEHGGRWNVMLMPLGSSVNPYHQIANWELDGVIGFAGSEEYASAAAKLPFPFVNSCGLKYVEKMPSVGVDDHEIGRMAGEYFSALGFRNMIYTGGIDHHPYIRRLEGFVSALREAGIKPHVVDHRNLRSEPVRPLQRVLAQSPRPVAVFGGTDSTALAAHNLCRSLGFSIPDEVAILGVDDDELFCQSVFPSLSSIRWPGEKVGYESARILEEMMAGKEPPSELIYFSPEKVVERLSTDTLAIEDPVVLRAVLFIRENACIPIGLKDVIKEMEKCHQALESRFKKALGRTVGQEIRRIRFQRVNELLQATDLTLEAIAYKAGFADGHALSIAYRRFTGTSPGVYRKEFNKM